MDIITRRDGLLFNNVVFMQGLGLAPLIVVATSVDNALMLCAAVLMLLIPTHLLAGILSRFAPLRFRGVIYGTVAASVYVGVSLLMTRIFGMQLQYLGLYLPLLVADPLIIGRFSLNKNEKIFTSLRKGARVTVSYIFTILFIATVRELVGFGTIYGVKIINVQLMPIAQLVCGAFMLLALFGALWQFGIASFKKRINLGVKNIDSSN